MLSSQNLLRDLFALLAGGVFTLSFAPFNLGYPAIPALLVLFASWRNCSLCRAGLRGFYFGLSAFGFGVSWVFISIHDYGGADVVSASALTVLFVVFWALFPALAGIFTVALKGAKNPFVTALVWVLSEYLRGVLVLNGFPWLLSAYSQMQTPLAGFVPVVGAYGVGFLLALSAALAVLLLIKHPRRRMISVFLGLLWLSGGLLRSVEWTRQIGPPIQATMIQGNIDQNAKWLPENKLNTLMLYKNLTEAHWDSDVIIWPETAIPAFLSEVDANFLAPLQQAAKQHHADLIVSLPIEGKSETEIINGVLTLGEQRRQYHKNHLLPFGEYMPLQPLSGYILSQLNIGLGDFTAGGEAQPLLTAAGYPFITSICYEDAFGVTEKNGLAQAAFLVNVTNDAWFGDSFEPHQHLQIAAMRALESGRYLLRATNTGVTAAIASDGTIIKQAPGFTTTVLTAMIKPMAGLTPYAKIGDQAIITMLTILLLAIRGYQVFRARQVSNRAT